MFKGMSRPIKKREAGIVAVLFGAALIYLVIDLVKSIKAGAVFNDLKMDILIIIAVGIVEWSMLNIAFRKADSEENDDTEN
ncbi:MAG: hypothetical protein K6A91_04680 [Clostridia bacterium]|nr:hypothetical protein [Bacillota bacterium]MBR6236254.1 hypothetical protein [Bacillota bacterium]MCR5010215.1 hypothetical protein [Clostridia bacterium]